MTAEIRLLLAAKRCAEKFPAAARALEAAAAIAAKEEADAIGKKEFVN